MYLLVYISILILNLSYFTKTEFVENKKNELSSIINQANTLDFYETTKVNLLQINKNYNIENKPLNITTSNNSTFIENDDFQPIIISLINVANVNYGMRISLGSPGNQYFNVIVDSKTTSNWILGTDCNNCNPRTNRFDVNRSSSYKKLDGISQFNYTYEGVTGQNSLDLLGLNSMNLKSSQTKFAVINDQWRLDNLQFDGIISLSFPGEYFKSLKSLNYIKEAIIGLNLRDSNSQSYLTIGVPEKIKPKILWQDIFLIENNPHANWNFKSKSISLDTELILTDKNFIINSMSNLISIPKKDFFMFKDKFFPTNSNCQINSGNYFICQCNQEIIKNYKNIRVTLDNGVLEIQPSDYLGYNVNSYDYDNYCKVLISLNYKDDFWMLGSNFINKYFTLFDFDNNKVGFYLNDDNNSSGGSNVLMITIMILVGSIIFFSLIYLLYKRFAGPNRRLEENQIDNRLI